MTNEEALLMALTGSELAETEAFHPQNNEQAYLAYALGLLTDPDVLPEPQTIEQALLKQYCLNGSSGGGDELLAAVLSGSGGDEIEISGITNLRDYALYKTAFRKVRFHDVTTLGAYACASMTQLESIEFPAGLTSVSTSTLSGSSNIREVIWNSRYVSSVGSSTTSLFKGISKIERFTFGDDVKYIPEYLLRGSGAENLSEIELPSGLEVIGRSAFSGIFAESISIPELVTVVGGGAFSSSKIKTLIWNPPNISSIGSSTAEVFGGCSELEECIFGKNVKTIPANFLRSSGVRRTTIPDSVTYIGTHAFNTTNLEALILENDHVVSMSNSNAINFTPISSGTGYIYVKMVCIDEYATATNWSVYAAQLRPNVKSVADLDNIDGAVYDRAYVKSEDSVYIYDGVTWNQEVTE